MNEETAAVFQREGEITFPVTEDTAEETAADSQSEGENKEEGAQSDDGKKSDGEKEPAFHEHPRWKEREDEWNKRFNDQESRHANELKTAIESIRSEFGDARKDNAQQTKIPSWFGGTQEQWDAYRTDRDAELKSAQAAAIETATKQIKESAGAESNAVKEATDFMNSEVAAIESNKELNPAGTKIDREALLKVVLENELIDSKGRWNYRAGFKILNGSTVKTEAKVNVQNQEKKKVAAATTTSETTKDSSKDTQYATPETFKKNRPW